MGEPSQSSSRSTEDNDSFGGLGDEDEMIEKSKEEKMYDLATLCVRNNATDLPKESLLYLYARFKHVSEGPCNTPRPSGFFNFEV